MGNSCCEREEAQANRRVMKCIFRQNGVQTVERWEGNITSQRLQGSLGLICDTQDPWSFGTIKGDQCIPVLPQTFPVLRHKLSSPGKSRSLRTIQSSWWVDPLFPAPCPGDRDGEYYFILSGWRFDLFSNVPGWRETRRKHRVRLSALFSPSLSKERAA